MKNIIIVVPTLASGGAEKQAALLAKSLSVYYHIHLFLMFGDISIAESNRKLISDHPGIFVHPLKGSVITRLYKLFHVLKSMQIDVALNYLTFCDLYCALVERCAGVKKIYNGIRNSRLPLSKMIAERIGHNLLATGTIFNCYSGAEFFQTKGFNKSKCLVIPNCFPQTSVPIQRDEKEDIKIITVGRFVPQKDYETAIKAVSKIKKRRIRFQIVGYGELEDEIRDWIKEYGISDITSVYINPPHVQELLRDADIYLSTSLFEGTSNSIMEALNWSLPVVATNVGDNNYLIKNEGNGFLHAIGDAEGLAKSLEVLIESSTRRNQMGIKGNHLLKEHYSVGIFEKRYRDLIEK